MRTHLPEFKEASCKTWSLMLLFLFFVALMVFSSLGNAIIILILYPQLGKTDTESAKAETRNESELDTKNTS